MPPWNSALNRPGVVKIIRWGGGRMPFGPCGRCGRPKPLMARHLCSNCHYITGQDGTRDEYGYPKDARISDWIALRSAGLSIPDAAERMAGIASARTCQRYEAELAKAGRAPWRRTDPNIRKYPGRV